MKDLRIRRTQSNYARLVRVRERLELLRLARAVNLLGSQAADRPPRQR